MTDESSLPRAVREALAEPGSESAGDDARETLELFAELALRLEPSEPSSALGERLLKQTSHAPLRYAPFFSRLSRLFDLDEATVEHHVAGFAAPKAWKRTGLAGVQRIQFPPGPALEGAATSFVRFEPGAHFPRHRHLGFEQVFVLEGSYSDESGKRYGPGTLHEMETETEHEFWVDPSEPCIAASVLHAGLEFTRYPLKFFNFLMKR
jgi:predicted ChrR family anti-sigma factor